MEITPRRPVSHRSARVVLWYMGNNECEDCSGRRNSEGNSPEMFCTGKRRSTSFRHELCAQYFCNNGKCENDPASVGQFKEQDDDVVLVIQNVNINNSGQYSVSLNNLRDVYSFTLDVQESAKNKEKTQMLRSSVLTWSVSVISVAVVLSSVVIGVLYCTKKIIYCGRKPTAAEHELENLETART